MNAQWKKFTGSKEQINEMREAKQGFKVKAFNGRESYWLGRHDVQRMEWKHVSDYMILNPHPHAEMIIEWARTGREVYFYHPEQQKWRTVTAPVWHPSTKYSFNPDGDGNARD